MLNHAKKLNEYTFTKCKSDKVFSKSQRWVLPNRMMDTTLDIYSNIRVANSISLKDGAGENDPGFRQRRRYQETALHRICAFYGMLEIAANVYNVPFNNIEHWTELTSAVEDKLLRWMESDLDRVRRKSK